MFRIPLLAIVAVAIPIQAAEPRPLVEQYLHSGELATGDRALQRALEATPKDDQLRFSLGVLRFVRAVERLGQSLHEHGVKSESTNLSFLRLPIPKNPDPTPITYPIFRRMLEQFTDDLAKAEKTLSEVSDDRVQLPLQLAEIRLDFVGDGKSLVTMLDVMKKILGPNRFGFLEKNPKFLVKFDRGDVAWLRGYCHLLSAMLDFYLAMDGRWVFELGADDLFARPKGLSANKQHPLFQLLTDGIKFVEPGRLHSFRMHMLKVCELNRESWRFIRAEKDDDFEWLPNAKQKSVIGLPVQDAMIDAWLEAVDEVELLLQGKKLIDFHHFAGMRPEMGFNLKTFLEEPPAKLDIQKIIDKGVDARYQEKLTQNNRYDDDAFLRVMNMFGDSLGIAYMAWFN